MSNSKKYFPVPCVVCNGKLTISKFPLSTAILAV